MNAKQVSSLFRTRARFAGSLLFAFCAIALASSGSAKTLDLGSASLDIDPKGMVALKFDNGTTWPQTSQPAFVLKTEDKTFWPRQVEVGDTSATIAFEDGSTAHFSVQTSQGFSLWRLTSLEERHHASRLRLFSLAFPAKAKLAGAINAAYHDGCAAAVMAAEPNTYTSSEQARTQSLDRAGCSHKITQTTQSKSGSYAARFDATCDATPAGWSTSSKNFSAPLDLRNCAAIRAWVHGDSRHEQLKIQLSDGAGGYRDDYIPIDFSGWRQITLKNAALNTLNPERVRTLSLYYNGLPSSQSVSCLVDRIEAIIEQPGAAPQTVVLEDFEDAVSPWWTAQQPTLDAEALAGYGLQPAAVGILACPEAQFMDTVERFEHAAGLPSPRLEGVWNKKSPAVKRSYLFLTNFGESQFDEALALARRGGFGMILLGQESWCEATGHYAISKTHFPSGLEGLKRTMRRFKDAGFGCGLHFLGASIYPPDPYLTPKPDPRLVKDASSTLAADVDSTATFIPLTQPPTDFPEKDGGYMGNGVDIQIGDELITYAERKLSAPYGLAGCTRAHLGTTATAHKHGERVSHLLRSYGYHLFDMDTTLLDEVTSNFARVADACDADMIYFDGSEALQGAHWYYNARLHKAFYDKLARKDRLFQASSFSHYSWHLLARSASADGHDDLKAYLEERSPAFSSFEREGMPLDIGWYYGYDPRETPDMFEYVLGSTIGYNSSMSFQVSLAAAATHPFTGEILDLISRYEKLRLSGRVPEEMRARLRVDPILAGGQSDEERQKKLSHRRDFRLLGAPGKEVFQRVVYEPWQKVNSTPDETTWTVNVEQGPARVGVQLQLLPEEKKPDAGAASATSPAAAEQPKLTELWVEVGGKRIEWKGELLRGQYLFLWPGESAARYGLPLKHAELSPDKLPEQVLGAGEQQVRFGTKANATIPLRVRLTLQPPENYPVP